MSAIDAETTEALIIISIVTIIIIAILISWYFYQRQNIQTRFEIIGKTNYSQINVENDADEIKTDSTSEIQTEYDGSVPLISAPPLTESNTQQSDHLELEPIHTRDIGVSFSTMLADNNSSFLDHVDSVRILADVRYSISHRTERGQSAAKQIEFIKSELIETEKSYLNSLHILMDEFLTPIFAQNLIDSQHKAQITSNLPEIIQFHEAFLQKLSTYSISKVFNEESENFMIYTKYICDYHTILDIFAQCRKNEELQSFLAQKRREKKPLSNYLVAPIQRIPRYILLLSDLKKHTKSTQCRDIDYALDKITKVCNAINEKQREIENMSQCMKISENLKNLDPDFDIVTSERMYIAHFLFLRKSDGRKRQFFVFNDVVIIANKKWKTKKIVKLENFAVYILDSDKDKMMINIFDDQGQNTTKKVLFEAVKNGKKHNVKSDIAEFNTIINENKCKLHKQKYGKLVDIGPELIALMSQRGVASIPQP